MKIPVSDLRSHADHGEGDFLVGLDNGYVVETEDNDSGYLTYPGRSTYSAALPSETVLVTFHDADGNECYLIVPSDFEVEVTRNA